MRTAVSIRWVPKLESTADEYEDAYFVGLTRGTAAQGIRIGISDGASESFLSGPWARILVKTICRSHTLDTGELLRRATENWEQWLIGYRRCKSRALKWWERDGIASGAHATLLFAEMARVSGSPGGYWFAVAFGDSCLFVVRDESVVVSFPLQSTADFGRAPTLVTTKPARLAGTLASQEVRVGTWRSGDEFYLATDALAAWCLQQVEAGEQPWTLLSGLLRHGAKDFSSWISALREGGLIIDDDVTLVRVAPVAL